MSEEIPLFGTVHTEDEARSGGYGYVDGAGEDSMN